MFEILCWFSRVFNTRAQFGHFCVRGPQAEEMRNENISHAGTQLCWMHELTTIHTQGTCLMSGSETRITTNIVNLCKHQAFVRWTSHQNAILYHFCHTYALPHQPLPFNTIPWAWSNVPSPCRRATPTQVIGTTFDDKRHWVVRIPWQRRSQVSCVAIFVCVFFMRKKWGSSQMEQKMLRTAF